jgi:starch phosphorylase
MTDVINKLNELSYNLFWTWNNEFFALFEDVDKPFWDWTGHNPVKFLEKIDTDYLINIIEKKNLAGRVDRIFDSYKNYMSSRNDAPPKIAYFSAEYGLTECLRFYSGGLGILSGDHMKSSSDINLPLVGIGLAYQFGYMLQKINSEGRQQEIYLRNEFERLPLQAMNDDEGNKLKIKVRYPNGEVTAQVWKIRIGRIDLLLLDTNTEENTDEYKSITNILYGGDNEKRIQQEIMLGIGGVRLLKKLNYDIKAFHLNEGHSAFLCFEKIRYMMKDEGIDLKTAKERCYNTNLFTTHTPVPAGIDIFTRELMEKYFKSYAEDEMNITFDELFAEGGLNYGTGTSEVFNMAHLAIKNSTYINGVSRLHGEVASKMWMLPAGRNPITYVTNGIHTLSYLSINNEHLYKKYLGEDWAAGEFVWDKISIIPDKEIWKVRNENRKRLVKFIRQNIEDNLKSRTNISEVIKSVKRILNPQVLTIGFARRFATYKRANLIFRDLERLKKILLNEEMPVQLIFSGKAHPLDEPGKEFISNITSLAKGRELFNKVIFIENYDIEIAKMLVSGCDVWLNNPRKPLEASGTSGMKIIANGGLNLSIPDGWWDEAYTPETGWKIESASDTIGELTTEEQDKFEAESLYSILENEVIPMFYRRNEADIPAEWIKKIKASMKIHAGYFNTERMVKEYSEKFYDKITAESYNLVIN